MSSQSIENIYRLSPLQEGMLFHSLSDPDAGQYVEQTLCTVVGDLDPAALRRGWEAAVARHSVLRASFHWEEVDRPVQVVYRQVDVPWREEDWRALPEEAQEARFAAVLDADRRLGFDLDRPPLLRISLIRLGERAWRFLWSHHHLLLDGWSLTRVLEEVFAGYAGLSGLPPARPYVDYIAWLEQQDLAEAETFWRRTLAGFATATPLPMTAAAAVRGTPSFEDRILDLTPAESSALDEAARRAGVTLGTLVQAAWALFLSRATGEEEVVFGTVVSGRPPHLRGSESMVGLFINTLPVRVRIEEREVLAAWLRRLQEQLLELRRFEHSPLAEVQTWSGVRPGEPLFRTLVAFENFPRGTALQEGPAGLEVRDIEVSERTNYPLNVAAVPLQEGLQLRLSWDRRFYDPDTAERLLGHLRTLLAGMAAGLDRPLEDLSLLDDAGRLLLVEWNGAVEEVPDVPVDVLLGRVAAERGEAPAVVGPDGTALTYRGLWEQSGRLARRLRELGVGPEVPVGLCLERSPDLVAAMIGVWRAGGAWVPLDPEYPPERLRFLREDAGMAVLVEEKDVRDLKDVKDNSNRDLPSFESFRSFRSLTSFSSPGNTAYLIYTSGSTGRPKGVVTSHRGLLSFLLAARRILGLGPESRVPQTTSPSFDASVLEIFPTLLAGGTLFVLSRDTLLSGPGLADELRRLAITEMAVVPSFLATIPEGDFPALRTVIVGAERCPAEIAARWSAGRRFFNAYGPTETTVFLTTFDGAGEPPQGPPIGRPIANAEVYVVDRLGRLVPPGVPGELWLGGAGLARGYLRQPGLTAGRFVPHPFAARPGERLYRSGDLARWRPDGNLEFLGRIDHQVKIRGHRVECGEVEAVLARHPGVREAAVIGRDGSLVAYVVPVADEKPEPGELRRFLATLLPAWMIPAAWVVLDALPLSPSGKVDRRALARIDPEPERRETSEDDTPRSPAEEILARVWADVLRVERVGVHDDFFDLGGNSILSIQVVSRAAEAGLQVTPRQVFENPTVGALAAVAVPTGGEAGTVAVEGPAPLTPIQRAFFERGPADPHRFNMPVLLTPREPFDTVSLERALGILLDRHDALRLRFEKREGEWTQRVDAPGGPVPLVRIDLSALPAAGRETAFAEAADTLQGSLDLERTLVRAGLVEGRLLLIIHHLAVDAVSWRVLLEDFERAYAGDRLPPATTPFARWAGTLETYAGTAEAARELPFWRAQADAAAGHPPLPIDGEQGDDVEAASRFHTVSLDAATTRAFLKDAHRAYQTRPDELLLAALAEAVGPWTGERALWIDVEGHGRQPVFAGAEGIDLSRTVGWFTTIHPVWLDLRDAHGPGEAVQAAKESLRRVPHRGLGYGVLRHLAGTRFPEPRAEISFNYLGQVDLLLGSSALFEVDPAPPGLPRSPRAARPYRLEVNAFVRDGRLTVSWTYGERRHRRETVERLAERFLAGLTGLIEHCLAPEAGGVTPSDFYRLSPLQEGMLFESLYASEGDAYVVQAAWTLEGDLDAAALRRAWEHLVERHAVLRTSFHWKEREHPHQVVHPPLELPWTEEDWREIPAGERERRLEEREAADRGTGFDLETAPLFRLRLVRLEDRLWSLVWTQHHLLLDGWSVGLVLRELFAVYGAFRRGAAPRLPPAQPFRAYIEWLLRRDPREAEAFWRRELAGFTAPTPVGGSPEEPPRRHAFGARGRAGAVLDPADLARLSELARRHRLTLNTFVQGAWAQLLARRSGEDDVVFGVVVSGRVVSGQPAELPGIESAVGPFINTIPLRARLAPGDRLLPWLAALQERQVEARGFEHSSLVEVQGWSEVPRGLPLFESLLAFEGSLVDPTLAKGTDGVRILAARTNQVSRAPLTLVAIPEGGQLDLQLVYDGNRFEAPEILRQAGHLLALLRGMAAHPERALGELPFLTEAERQQILVEWQSCSSLRSFTSFDTLHGLFLAQAQQTPEAVALVFEGKQATYSQLAERSGRLAARLRELGVGPEVRVAISLPRSPELVVTLLAVLQAGGAYVPLDPDDPPERRAWIAADCGATLVIDSPAFLPSPARGRGAGGEGLGGGRSLRVLPESLAYVIYTSGTTGRPKGAMVPHLAAVNHILWAQSAYGLEPGDAVLLKTPIGFDVSVRELFWPLSVGAPVVIARPGGERDPGYLLDLIEREGVTVANFVPSLLAAVLDRETTPALKRIIAGGEALSADLAERCFRRLPDTALHNHYGPTETAVNATAWACRPGERPVPIGRPIGNVRIDLLDAWGSPVPIGVAGEIHVGGAGVGRGYLGRPDLTAERFLPDPREPGARRYRTGDLARWRPDGALEFLGRRDHQIKVRGLRVEPEEVEAALVACPGVHEAAVIARDGALVAFVMGSESEDLRAVLAARLPAFLIPSAFVPVDSLPRTASGKVDRRSLARREIGLPARPDRVPPRDDLERELAGIWEDLLGVRLVGARDDFFTLGGHSLLAVRLASRVEARFGGTLPIATLFERRTVEALADWLRPSVAPRSSSPLVRIQPDGSRPPLFMVHPGGGGVLCYAELARALGPDQPLYGLQAAGLDGERGPLDRIGAMADLYLEAICSIQPAGPWHLGGWSFGGLVAYEMACRLAERNEPAGLVAILDVAPRGGESRTEDETVLLVRGLDEQFLQTVPLSVDDLRGLDTRGQVAVVLEKARRAGRLSDDFDERRAAGLVEVFKANLRAARTWEPRPYPGRITVVRAAGSHRLGPDHAGGWSALAAADVTTVPGDHWRMVEPPFVETLAQTLRSALDGWV